MLALDLFNTPFERALNEGAVDDLEARRIHHLNTRMLELMSRANDADFKASPEGLAGLKREYQKLKDERDGYYKIREAGIPGNIPTEKIPGKEDLLKGRGRTYYEGTEENDDWYDRNGRPNPHGAYDAGGNYYADREDQDAGYDAYKERNQTSEATGDSKFDAMMGRIGNDPWTQLNSDPNWEYEIEELVDQHIEPWLLAMEKSGMPITRDGETLNPGWRKRYEQISTQLAQKYLASKKFNPRDPDLVGRIRAAIDNHTDQSRNVAGQLSAYADDLPLHRYADAFDADGMTANIRDAMAGLAPRDDDDDGYAPRPAANPRRLDPGNMEEAQDQEPNPNAKCRVCKTPYNKHFKFGSDGKILSTLVRGPCGRTPKDFPDLYNIEEAQDKAVLDKYKERVGTLGNLQKDNERYQDWRDSHHAVATNFHRNQQRRHDADTDDKIERMAIDRDRLRQNDDDWKDTFDMMRDRINRYQWSTQGSVDPKKLKKISNIKYKSNIKEEQTSDQNTWMKQTRAKHPTAKFMQAKMPGAPIRAYVNGKVVAEFNFTRDQKKNSESVNEYISMGSDKNYVESEPYKNYRIYVRKKPFGTTGMYTAHTEIDRKEFMGKGSSQEEAVQAIRDRIDFVLNAQRKVTGSSTIDFNVKFATDLLADPKQTFYAKLENINGEPKLVIASSEVAADPELLAAGDFKRSALRNQPDEEGRATPLPGIPLTAKGLRSGDWIANGRYTVGKETQDRDGNRVFDLTYHSTAHTKSDKLRLNQPAFTLGTAREVDEHGGGIGPRQHWQDLMPEQYTNNDDWYDDEDQDTELRSGDYVRDTMDGEHGEVFRMSGDPTERRVQILDRDGRGWYIEPSRLTKADPQDPDVQRYFGKNRQRDMDEAIVASGPSKPLDDRAVRKMVWDTMKINADTGEQAIQRALAVLAKKPQSRMVQDLQDKFQSLADRLAQGVAEEVDRAGALKAAQAAAKFMIRNLDDRAALKDYSMHFWSPEKFYQGATMAMRGAGHDEIVQHITQDRPAQFEQEQKPGFGEFPPKQEITIVPPKKLKSGETYQDRNKYWQSQGQAPIYKTNEDTKGVAESAKPGEYYVHTVYFKDGTKKRVRVTSDEFDVANYYTKRGQAVDRVDYDFQLHSDMAEGLKSTLAGAALAGAMALGGAGAAQAQSASSGLPNATTIIQQIQSGKIQNQNDLSAALGDNQTNRQFVYKQLQAKAGLPGHGADSVINALAKKSPAGAQQPTAGVQQPTKSAGQSGVIIQRPTDNFEGKIKEDQDSSGVERAILNRIMVAHTDLLMKFGPDKVMQAAEEVAYNVGDVDEIGTSDVSAYVAQVKQILGATA